MIFIPPPNRKKIKSLNSKEKQEQKPSFFFWIIYKKDLAVLNNRIEPNDDLVVFLNVVEFILEAQKELKLDEIDLFFYKKFIVS